MFYVIQSFYSILFFFDTHKFWQHKKFEDQNLIKFIMQFESRA
jgi:hypothetical protein